MSTTHQLSFRVSCAACYGVEIWKLNRIVRVLSKIPDANMPAELPPDFDLDFLAEQFVKFSKQISCPGCGKIGTLQTVRTFPQ
jgi:hypothetical protein